VQLRLAQPDDFDQIWIFFHEITQAGDTYAYPRDLSKQDAEKVWMQAPRATYVCEADQRILGSYFIKTNQSGPGSHVCNCGYMVSAQARGRGLATAMCEHSQEVARELGYKAVSYTHLTLPTICSV